MTKKGNKIIGLLLIGVGVISLGVGVNFILGKAYIKHMIAWGFFAVTFIESSVGIVLILDKMSKFNKVMWAIGISLGIAFILMVIINLFAVYVYKDNSQIIGLKDLLLSLVLPISSTIVGALFGSNDDNKKINDKLDKIIDEINKNKQ